MRYLSGVFAQGTDSWFHILNLRIYSKKLEIIDFTFYPLFTALRIIRRKSIRNPRSIILSA